MSFFETIQRGLRAAWEHLESVFSNAPVGSPTTRCPLNDNCKNVSSKAAQRLAAAQEAMDYARHKLPYGAGNQVQALDATRFNSYFRMETARDVTAYDIPAKTREIASQNAASDAAAIAGMAELAQGGNCGEYAYVVFDYLRRRYPNEHIQVAKKKGFDHAFVIIGDPASERDDELVVADAWPTEPTPVLWEDHFAYTSDRSKVENLASSQGDARNYKQEMFDSGLKLNAKGEHAIQQSLSEEETDRAIEQGSGIWDQRDTATIQYDYVPY